MLTADEIRTFIESDRASERKQLALVGERYYNGDHDIKKKRIFFVNADGILEEDKTKSNVRIAHRFFTENVDQTTQYFLSGDGYFFKSDTPELQAELDERFNENRKFRKTLYDTIEGAVTKGFEYLFVYKDEDGRVQFECADSLGVVEVRAEATDDHCEYVIRYYTDAIEKDSKSIRRIEVWDAQQTTYYVQVDDGEITLDDSKLINPRPHTLFTRKGSKKTYFEGFGFIPFFKLPYNKKHASGVDPIKDLIDDYDEMNCGFSNMIIDTAEALYVVHGFEGNNLDELMMNIKAKNHIGVDEQGDVDIKTIDIPVEARKAKMEETKNNIYHFGGALNTEALKDTAATTNLAIEAAYSLLEMKRVKLQYSVEEFLTQPLQIVLDEINKANGTDYRLKDVYFDFQKEVPTNVKENAEVDLLKAQKKQTEINTILNLAQYIDDETRLQLICEQLDIDFNEIKDKLPAPEEAPLPTGPAMTALEEIPPEDGGGMSA